MNVGPGNLWFLSLEPITRNVILALANGHMDFPYSSTLTSFFSQCSKVGSLSLNILGRFMKQSGGQKSLLYFIVRPKEFAVKSYFKVNNE